MEATVEAAVDPAKAAGTTVAGLAKVERVMAGGGEECVRRGDNLGGGEGGGGDGGDGDGIGRCGEGGAGGEGSGEGLEASARVRGQR